jgi:hypothetical protein
MVEVIAHTTNQEERLRFRMVPIDLDIRDLLISPGIRVQILPLLTITHHIPLEAHTTKKGQDILREAVGATTTTLTIAVEVVVVLQTPIIVIQDPPITLRIMKIVNPRDILTTTPT